VGNPVWSTRQDSKDRALNQINQRDCLANATITFDVTATTATSAQLEVWAGTACTEKINRDESTNCVKAGEAQLRTNPITVRVQDLLQQPGQGSSGVNQGTDATCTPQSSATGESKRTLFFLAINSSDGQATGSSGKWEFEFDVIAPTAPTNVTAEAGEQSLTLSFTAPDIGDLSKYRLYCSNLATEAGAGAAGDAGNAACSSATLKAGEAPAEGAFECGNPTSIGRSSVDTDADLLNGTTYAVAMASEDKFGNISTVSNVACGTPANVTGFYEAYRAAGGDAGGGFCSFGVPKFGRSSLAVAALFLGVVLARRRR